MPSRPRQHAPADRRGPRRRRLWLLLACLLAALATLVVILSGGGAARRGHLTARREIPAAPARRSRSVPAHAGGGYPETSELRRLIALGQAIYCAPRRGNEVALTFDDGPGPYTRLMVDKLRKHHARATFFLVGRNVASMPGLPRRERALGAVGDHTFTHPLLTSLTAAQQESEIDRTQQEVARASRGPVFLFRPPYGAHNRTTDRIARSRDMLEVLWDVDSRDSLGANYAQIERTVAAGLRPGAIVLMHENHGQTVRAMLSIFAVLARRHLRAVSVPQLLSDDPPSASEVRAAGGDCGLARGARPGGD